MAPLRSCRATRSCSRTAARRCSGWLLDRVGQYVDVDREAARKFVAERMQLWGAMLASSTLVVVGGVVGAVVQTALVVFSMFYLFRDGERLRHALYDMLPLERIQEQEITVRTRDVVAATIYGVLVISAIQGTLGTLIFWFLGLPSPLLWGVVMFFLSMIPMAGSFLVWVPAALYLALTGEYTKAAILVGGASWSSGRSTISCHPSWWDTARGSTSC